MPTFYNHRFTACRINSLLLLLNKFQVHRTIVKLLSPVWSIFASIMVPHYIWKRLIRNEFLLCSRITTTLSLIPFPMRSVTLFTLNRKPGIGVLYFCTDVIPPTTSEKGIVTEFLLTRCGLNQDNITKAFRHCNRLLAGKSIENSENVLKLLKQCGLTTDQIRSLVLCNPRFMFLNAEKILQPKVAFFRSFMEEKDIAKFIAADATALCMNLERRLKPAIHFLRECGFEGQALSELLAKQPRLLTISNQKILEAFKRAEDFGLTRGSKMFAAAMQVIIRVGKDKLDRKLHCLKDLGLSEEEVSQLCKRMPAILGLSEAKLKRNMDFVINSLQLPSNVTVKYPILLACSLDTRIMPRHRVLEALKSMKILKKEKIFPSIVMMTEELFLKEYINSYDESSTLLDIYRGRNGGGPKLENGI